MAAGNARGLVGGGGHTRKHAAPRPACRGLRVGRGLPAAPDRTTGGRGSDTRSPCCGDRAAGGRRGGKSPLLLSSIAPVAVNSMALCPRPQGFSRCRDGGRAQHTRA